MKRADGAGAPGYDPSMATEGSSAYSKLERRFSRAMVVASVQRVLDWDSAVILPPGASAMRGEQLAELAVVEHEAVAGPEVGAWLETAEDETLTSVERQNLAEMKRRYAHATAVTPDLVAELARVRTRCESSWRRAREANDFQLVRGDLSAMVEVVRQVATAKGRVLGCDAYDALVDEHEPGLRQNRIDALFAPLREALPNLVERVLAAQGDPGLPFAGPFAVERQKRLGQRLMAALGFDFERGRLDVSAHPFCGGGGDDIRVTTRYEESDFSSALMGVLHECGHALYEFGLPPALRQQPVGQARGMAVHE
ncbi:MAG: carboxypeptidase M32, partial [Myxococcota bacterium]